MQKVFCDICKEEIKHNAKDFVVSVGKLKFALLYSDNGAQIYNPDDICLPCLLKAINKKAGELLKRKYTRKQKELNASM